MCRYWLVRGVIRLIAVREVGCWHGLQLAFGQCVELKVPAAVPQPSVGVGDAAHARWDREWCCQMNSAFNFGNDFWCVAWCAHPVGVGDVALVVDFNLQHANRIQHRWQLTLKDSVTVLFVQVPGCFESVVADRSGA